jgi:mevalonate kinase
MYYEDMQLKKIDGIIIDCLSDNWTVEQVRNWIEEDNDRVNHILKDYSGMVNRMKTEVKRKKIEQYIKRLQKNHL